MNHVFKLKYDKRHHKMVVVSEITLGQGKSAGVGTVGALASLISNIFFKPNRVALVIGLLAGSITLVQANSLPNQGTIFEGQGIIGGDSTNMQIQQFGSKLGINWDSFDIGVNNTVEFLQPDSNSIALNRVQGITQSKIDGTLKANGQVFLLNPNGILFGKYAQINVAGMVASTGSLSNEDFIKVTDGKYTFTQTGEGYVINQGHLTVTPGGYVVLAGQHVSNQGTITTPSGTTALAAGEKITLQLDNAGVTSVAVDGNVVQSLVYNGGLISAAGGKVFLTARGQDMLYDTVINNNGVIEAKGVTQSGGIVRLDGGASGAVVQGNMISVDSNTHKGGTVSIEGQYINLAKGSKTQATGRNGGEVYVGVGGQGKDANLRNADAVVMDKGSVIDVSSNSQGNGGTAVLRSEKYTNFQGDILAKGGWLSGNGGQIETSSRGNLVAAGGIDATASNGRGGEWLIASADLTISNGGADILSVSNEDPGIAVVDYVGQIGQSPSQVSTRSINSNLNSGTSVTISTVGWASSEGDITVQGDIQKTAGGEAALTITADRNINIANGTNITSTAGALAINMRAGETSTGDVSLVGNNISLNGGDLTVGSSNRSNNVSVRIDSSRIDASNVAMYGRSESAAGVEVKNSSIIALKDVELKGGSQSSDSRIGAVSVIGSEITGEVVSLVGSNQYVDSVVASSGVRIENSNLSGQVSIDGASERGSGVFLKGGINGASVIKGVSGGSAEGVIVLANLDGSKISGVSSSGTGVHLAGLTNTINGSVVEGASVSGQGVRNQYRLVENSTIDAVGELAGFYGAAGTILNSTVVGRATGTIGVGVKLYNNVEGGSVNGLSSHGKGILISDVELNNANISGVSNGSAAGVHIFGNVTLKGGTKIFGTSVSDVGVIQNGNLSMGHNSSLEGFASAAGSTGVLLEDSTVTNSTIKGFTNAGVGVSIINATISGSNVVGLSNGSGQGTSLSGDVTLKNSAYIAGESANGAGVSLTGDLSIRQKSSVVGCSTVSAGVFLDNASTVRGGTLTGISSYGTGVLANNVIIDGTSISGASNKSTGINIIGNFTSSGVILSGESVSGIGIEQVGNFEAENTSIKGNSAYREGVVLHNATIVGGNVSGTSDSHNGILIENTNLDSTNITGASSGSGIGALLTNNVTLSQGSILGSSIDGVGVVQAGDLRLLNNSYVQGWSTNGEGVVLRNSSVTGGTVQGKSINHNGILIENSALDGTNLSGISLNAGNGAILNKNVTLSGVSLLGSSVSGKGVGQQGNLQMDNSSSVRGNSRYREGVTLRGGTVTGGTLTGASTNDVGIFMFDTKAEGTNMIGVSNGSGTGAALSSNVTLSGVRLQGSGVSGRGVDQGGDLILQNGSSVLGYSSSGEGVALRSVTGGTVTGVSTSGYGVQAEYATLNSTNVSGINEGSGTGVFLKNIKLSGATVSGLSAAGKGVDQTGDLNMDVTSTVTGKSTKNSGVSLKGTTKGGVVNGTSDSGTGVSITNSKLTSTSVSGASNTGYGVVINDVTLKAGTKILGFSKDGVGVYQVGNVVKDETSSIVDHSATTVVGIGPKKMWGKGEAPDGNYIGNGSWLGSPNLERANSRFLSDERQALNVASEDKSTEDAMDGLK